MCIRDDHQVAAAPCMFVCVRVSQHFLVIPAQAGLSEVRLEVCWQRSCLFFLQCI